MERICTRCRRVCFSEAEFQLHECFDMNDELDAEIAVCNWDGKLEGEEAAMRVLVIDQTAKEVVETVMAYARKHVFYPSLNADVPGDNANHVCHLNTYRCVFTYTKDVGTGKLYRHLSVSVPSKDFPSVEAMGAIAGLFEFSEADQGVVERVKSGKWLMHVEKGEPHCIVLAEELQE